MWGRPSRWSASGSRDAVTGAPAELIASYGTTTPDLLELVDWLRGLGVTDVAMESTGVYWKPIVYLLEDDFTVLLVNAAHIKHVPGRKTDVFSELRNAHGVAGEPEVASFVLVVVWSGEVGVDGAAGDLGETGYAQVHGGVAAGGDLVHLGEL